MSMSITSSTATASANSTDESNRAQARKAFVQLGKDLKSGNVSAAQQDFASLTKNVPSKLVNDPNSALGQLNQALQSGDTSAAMTALGAVGKNVQSFRQAHDVSPEPVGPVSALPTASSTGGIAGTTLNEVA
jgi:hypothetical protein